MEKAKNINTTIEEYINGEWIRATVKGLYYRGEYDVNIYYFRNLSYSIFSIFDCERIVCKRLSTINKKLTEKGFEKGL